MKYELFMADFMPKIHAALQPELCQFCHHGVIWGKEAQMCDACQGTGRAL